MTGLRSNVFRSLAVLTILAMPALAAPSLAAAQEPTTEQRAHARELYGQGQAAYTAGHYQEALDAYQAAFREVQNPLVLLGVALAQEHLDQRAEARVTLERYLILRPDAPDRAAIETRIAALPAPTTGTVHVDCTPAGASIELDGHAIGTGTAETTTPAGAHTLRVSLTGHEPITRQIDVTAGHRVDLDLTLVAQAAAVDTAATTSDPIESEDDIFGGDGADTESSETAETPAPTPAAADPSAGVWVTTAIAGVALVTGTIFGFLALSKQSDYDAMPTAGTANDGEAFALVADLSFAVAAAAGITAIVLYATETPARPAESTASLQVIPLVSPTAGGVADGAHI
jgi:tetratricopeptide (TPR) repeat protein